MMSYDVAIEMKSLAVILHGVLILNFYKMKIRIFGTVQSWELKGLKAQSGNDLTSLPIFHVPIKM